MVYLKQHLQKYPLMQLEDILKLYLQGILGPAHLISSFDYCYKRVMEEYNSIKDEDYKQDLYEVISDKYVRVYLLPYYKKYKELESLVNMFIESSKDNNDIDEFIKEIKSLINKENKQFINDYLNSGSYLISHSQIYKDNYHPHYLVINSRYIDRIK